MSGLPLLALLPTGAPSISTTAVRISRVLVRDGLVILAF